MILPTKDIRDSFEVIYSGKEHSWLFPSYYLGFKTVIIKGTFHVEVPMKDPESVTAFNCGCLDGLELLQGRKELQQRSMSSPSTKVSTYKYSPSREEYSPGF
jgi:hypothetical protein